MGLNVKTKISLLIPDYFTIFVFDRIVYLNDNCPPRNQYVLTNCINIINEVYSELRRKYHIPQYIDKEKIFKMYLNDNEEIEEIYIQDLPEVSRSILKAIKNDQVCPQFLLKRIKKLKQFFELNE